MVRAIDWLRSSEARLCFITHIAWSNLFFALSLAATGTFNVRTAVIASILSAAIARYLTWARALVRQYPSSVVAKLLSFCFLLIPWSLLGWPAEKLHALFFRRFSCFNMGMEYCRRGNARKAIEELGRVETGGLDPAGRLSLLTTLADCLAKIGEYDRAAACYRRAIDIAPVADELRADLEQCRAMKEDFQQALRSCQEEMLGPSPRQEAGGEQDPAVAVPKREGGRLGLWLVPASGIAVVLAVGMVIHSSQPRSFRRDVKPQMPANHASPQPRVMAARNDASSTVAPSSPVVASRTASKAINGSGRTNHRHHRGRSHVNYARIHPTDTVLFE